MCALWKSFIVHCRLSVAPVAHHGNVHVLTHGPGMMLAHSVFFSSMLTTSQSPSFGSLSMLLIRCLLQFCVDMMSVPNLHCVK